MRERHRVDAEVEQRTAREVGSYSRLSGSNAKYWPWSAETLTISPISPRGPRVERPTCGRNRVHIASMTNTRAARAAAKICSASARCA